jgi:hypothetical protein
MSKKVPKTLIQDELSKVAEKENQYLLMHAKNELLNQMKFNKKPVIDNKPHQ